LRNVKNISRVHVDSSPSRGIPSGDVLLNEPHIEQGSENSHVQVTPTILEPNSMLVLHTIAELVSKVT